MYGAIRKLQPMKKFMCQCIHVFGVKISLPSLNCYNTGICQSRIDSFSFDLSYCLDRRTSEGGETERHEAQTYGSLPAQVKGRVVGPAESG